MSRFATFVLTAVSVLALTTATAIDTDHSSSRDDRSPAVAPQAKVRDGQWCC
jgi:hypothetical protein